MKFKSLLVAALAAVSLGASAQDESPKYEFNPYWSIQGQFGAGYHRGGEFKFLDKITPAAQVAVGYRFSRPVGARLAFSGWQGKNGWFGVDQYYKWNYAQATLDFMFDINTIISGYNPNRFATVYAILGGGFLHGFENNEAPAHVAPGLMTLLWEKNKLNTWVGRAGLELDLRLTKNLSFNIDALANITDDKFNSKDGDNVDWQFNLLGGLTYRFGDFDVEPINTYVPAPVVPAPAPAPAPAPKEYIRNIFFQINSAKISSAEYVKVNEIVAYLNANPAAKVAITGYADKGTGNYTINQRLGKQRANAVYNELIKNNIAASRITKDAKGDTVQPFAINEQNRVVIAIAE